MTSGRKLTFFGNERLVSGLAHTDAPILTSLITAGYEILQSSLMKPALRRVIKSARSCRSRSAHNIPVLSPKKPLDIYDQLAAFHADAGILVAYGRIVPQNSSTLFPLGLLISIRLSFA